MADSTQERTEQATQRRLEEAAAKGQVAYSRELTAALLLLVVLGALKIGGLHLGQGLAQIFRSSLRLEEYQAVAPDGITAFLRHQQSSAVALVLPILLSVLAIVALSGFLQVGFSVNARRVQLRWEKLNPINGMRRLLSSRSVMAVLFSILKMLIVGSVVWITLSDLVPRAADLNATGFGSLAQLFAESIFAIGFRVGALILLLAVADLLWQRWRHSRDLMMTKEEVKEDRKQSEGDPRVKGRIRQMQREVARARMLHDVKKATVVVRNPTHFAVALRYRPGQDRAPRVVAKGRNLLAQRIVELAQRAGVPVRTDPPLARQLFAMVRVGRVVPEELFQAVAKVLAWVYRRRGGGTASTGSERERPET